MTATMTPIRPTADAVDAPFDSRPADATADSDLIRRVDDMEIPALGTWPLVRASHVAIGPAPGAKPLEAEVHAGHLVSAPAVDDSTVHLALGHDGAVRFTGRPMSVAATPYGTVEWSLAGLVTCEQESAPMTLRLGYHGVYRRGGRAWAWFTGSGRISPWGEDTREVVVDLLFEAPVAPADAAAERR